MIDILIEKFERNDDKLNSMGVGKITLIKKWLESRKVRDYIINDDLSVKYPNALMSYEDMVKMEMSRPKYLIFRYTPYVKLRIFAELGDLSKMKEAYADGGALSSLGGELINKIIGSAKLVEGPYLDILKWLWELPDIKHYLSMEDTKEVRKILEKYKLIEGFHHGGPDKLSEIGIGKISFIKKWLEDMNIQAYSIQPDLSINCLTDVTITKKQDKFPDYIQFNDIAGNFTVENLGLITLKGFPKIIRGNLFCDYNDLKTLEYFPSFVDGDLYINGNNIPGREIEKIMLDDNIEIKGRINC